MKKLPFRFLLVLLALWFLPLHAWAAEYLIPGGHVIGLELGGGSITVAAFDDTTGTSAQDTGLQIGDKILSMDGHAVSSPADVRKALERADGIVEIGIERDGQKQSIRLSPQITQEGPRLGIFLKQGITGIGTVTYYDPQTGIFGTLGHGVNDKNGQLATLRSGNAYTASVLSVRKGTSGEPGQLMGSLGNKEPIGTLLRNTPQGVFGTMDGGFPGDALPVGQWEQIRTGEATILSTVSDDRVQEYSVEILKIYPSCRTEGRNMLLRVTDPALLSATGGIVQGMSGSPIIQDGKLVGAVTHVLVNDPTRGYGIFIENMLDAAA